LIPLLIRADEQTPPGRYFDACSHNSWFLLLI
jgi:hypothetical protein